MAKYMILFKSTISAKEQMANSTPEQIQTSMQEWTNWKGDLDTSIGFEWGLPMQTIAEVTTSEVLEGNSPVTGYATMQGDKDAVTEILKSHPHLKIEGTTIDVLEMIPMSGV
jgi:hypothetical protein